MLPFLSAIFSRFHDIKDVWTRIVNILTELDCLLSLSICSSQAEGEMCLPEIIPYEGEFADKSIFDVKDLRHPCVAMPNGKQFIPNDTFMSPGDGKGLLLVTGPNMGGKSTILRQNCLATILAQIGCYVPASSFRLTPADRIFTRLGASDRILEGKSTFFVEMEETRNVLNQGTFKSLAILDELGRGTSTFDGQSIAHAVLNHIIRKVRCRCMFSTHHHMLLEEFGRREGVVCYHMAFSKVN